jgi:hypothetical protein
VFGIVQLVKRAWPLWLFIGFGLLFFTSWFGNSSSFPIKLLTIGLALAFLNGVHIFFSTVDSKVYTKSEQLTLLTAAISGTVLTYVLTPLVTFNVISAALVGLWGWLMGRIFTRHGYTDVAPVIYCGTFVGMASAQVMSLEVVLVAGAVSGFLFLFLCNNLNGCGGKLGSIAFLSCGLTIGLTQLVKVLT